jgi:hypothetical protein
MAPAKPAQGSTVSVPAAPLGTAFPPSPGSASPDGFGGPSPTGGVDIAVVGAVEGIGSALVIVEVAVIPEGGALLAAVGAVIVGALLPGAAVLLPGTAVLVIGAEDAPLVGAWLGAGPAVVAAPALEPVGAPADALPAIEDEAASP